MPDTRSPRSSSSARVFVLVAAVAVAAWAATGIAQSPNAFGTPSADKPQPGAAITAVPGSRAQGWLAQGRSEVVARHGIVSTSDPLAAQAGLEILQKGGNAIDAAVATGAVLDVTSQNDTGIGGDLFALVYVAKDKKLYALNSAGWAPAGWTPEFFTGKLAVKTVPNNGVNAATVPGAISGYDALLKRFGTMTFKDTFERAARIAEEGWGQAERRHQDLRNAVNGLRADPDSKAAFLIGDQAPALYSIIRNPGLAKALRAVQQQGRDAFYKGEIAAAIVKKVQANGGVMAASDLAEFQSEWIEPVSTNYHGYDVFELPPPGQGFAALEMLNILEVCVPKLGMNLAALGPSDPMYWHLMVEAKKLAYADLLVKNADPKFAAVPIKDLLSKTYAATLCSKIDPNVASKTSAPTATDGGTIYLTAADRWGNMVSLIHSVFSVYGSRATVAPYGFVLHNRGSAFSLDPKSPNIVAPHKRPFHTIIAGFVMKDGQPLMTFGNMGGSVQPETHAQHMVNLIDHGMNVQMTTDAARFTHNQTGNVLSLENNLFGLVGAALKAKGHEVRAVSGGSVGGYQGILFTRDPRLPEPTFDRRAVTEDLPVNGVYRGGSDHRKDGQAVGW
ncbi:MAG: gamma-glutamyltransferase [Acidobacteria bacterium RIFCSPLOWO2_02_FULL_65_29]|nr:MAG: gamma-glutamyltransferase [Acidobacteria bacterium RIFCSPLOWO2_02_FULL_65_29]